MLAGKLTAAAGTTLLTTASAGCCAATSGGRRCLALADSQERSFRARYGSNRPSQLDGVRFVRRPTIVIGEQDPLKQLRQARIDRMNPDPAHHDLRLDGPVPALPAPIHMLTRGLTLRNGRLSIEISRGNLATLLAIHTVIVARDER